MPAPRILIVKLSSLGDVVHAMPAVQDILLQVPGAQIDWVVERSFAPLVRRCSGVQRVIECELRRWRKAPVAAETRLAWRAFRSALRAEAYDVVIDLQGLTKSALVARMARLIESGGTDSGTRGKRYAMANQTDGSGYEAPTRWVADVAIALPTHIHAVARSRQMCAQVFGYRLPDIEHFGLSVPMDVRHTAIKKVASTGSGKQLGDRPQVTQSQPRQALQLAQRSPIVAFVHGTSRADKEWPVAHWLELGRRLNNAGVGVVLAHGSDAEQWRSERIAAELSKAEVWPRLGLDALTERLSACTGVIGVDSGLSHIAVALDLPHVQLYNFDTAWRTGPGGAGRQVSVFGTPAPTVDDVWGAWQRVVVAHSAPGGQSGSRLE